MATIKEALMGCENVASEIMGKVDSKLSDSGINFTHNNKSEIIVENSSKDDIVNTLSDIDGVDNDQTKLLLQITESNSNVFIRQKFN